MSLQSNLKNENILNLQDKGKVQKKHRKGSILIKLIIIFLIAFSFLFGEKIYDKIIGNYEVKEYYDSKKTKIKTKKIYKNYKIDLKCIYNKDETIKKIIYYDNGKLDHFFEYKYDNGYKINRILHDTDGTPIIDIKYIRIKNETKKSVIKMFDSKNNVYQKTVFQYDKEGKKLKSTVYDANNNVENYYIYNYDSKGKEIGYTMYDANGNASFQYEKK